ncbi:hypothetical protein JBL43_11275 [Aureibaculum sp. A20]|uniref:Uncharacterized protein n=1 Tax=Aureibaculum flavum TaxID=2795986 RepID=A0ABS0WS79_9FLAO|nr:hypothetical protein [Aureibaculum flavum]MBJ2174821.1 hypothetical protein [Aureibaculum flavum]
MKKIILFITLIGTFTSSHSQVEDDSTKVKANANIHGELKAFQNQPHYKLIINSQKCEVDVFINGIEIKPAYGANNYDLNNFITDKFSSIKIIANPGYISYPENGVISKRKVQSFRAYSKLSAMVIEEQTLDTLKTIDTTELEGSEPFVFQFKFDSKLPYYPETWKNGVNLRKDEKLKAKIIALFDKLGKAILENDEHTINNLFYIRQYEIQQLDFDTKIETTTKLWKEIVALNEPTKNYTVTEDFNITYYADGKLVYIQPENILDMLIFNGKTIDTQMSYMLYQPEESDELKIIK